MTKQLPESVLWPPRVDADYTPANTRASVPQRQKTKMARNTNVHEDYTHRQGLPSRENQPCSRKQGERKWHDKVSKLISWPQYSVTYRTESWNTTTNRLPIFPGPAEASLESNETFTGADERKGWRRAQQSHRTPPPALPLPSTGQPPPLPPVELALTYVFWENKFL